MALIPEFFFAGSSVIFTDLKFFPLAFKKCPANLIL